MRRGHSPGFVSAPTRKAYARSLWVSSASAPSKLSKRRTSRTTSLPGVRRSSFSKGDRARRSRLHSGSSTEAEPLGPSIALARAYSALEGGYLDTGQPDKAVFEAKAVDMFRSLGAARSAAVAEMNLGVKAYAQGRWQEATRLYGNARKEFERVGDTTQAAHAGANLGEVLISRGLLEEAERVLSDADNALRAAGYHLAAMFTETQLARLAIERGDLARAIETLAARWSTKRERAAMSDPRSTRGSSSPGRSRGAVKPSEPFRELQQAAALVGDNASPDRVPLARELATALMQLGKLAEAADELSTAIGVSRAQGLAYEEAQAHRALAELAKLEGRESDAADALHEAERLMQRVGETD